MFGTRDLPPDEAERVREAMRRYLAEECDGNKAEFARRLKSSRQMIIRNLDGPDSPSFATARKMAGLLGIDERELREGKRSSSATRIPGMPASTGLRWPRMAPAIWVARDLKIDEAAIAEFVETMNTRPPKNASDDLDALEWLGMLRSWYEERWRPRQLLGDQEPTKHDAPPKTVTPESHPLRKRNANTK